MKQSNHYSKMLVSMALFALTNSSFAQANPSGQVYEPISLKPFLDSSRHWYGIHDDSNIINPSSNQPKYKETEITKIADNILLYQRNNGGWPKNYDVQAILTLAQADSLVKTKNMVHTTFDNSTTYTHVDYLARVYAITHIDKYKVACENGIKFILKAQFDNGGWPQYFPLEKEYSRHITYNDGAYIGVMEVLKKVVNNHPDYAFLDVKLRKRVVQAYNKGISCILKTQIEENGKLTAWGQQHDEVTLKPAWARAFEPPCICNGESAGIVLFLMSLEHPDAKTIRSIQSAVKWFQDSRIFNTRVMTIQAPPEKSKWRTSTTDRVVVKDSLAPQIWTRYYELGTEKPMFSDRNSKILYSLSDVSRERRSGYGWYTYAPQEVLDKYPQWQKRWAPEENVLTK
jgi:pectate lyase, PelA/Pel-15E family